MRRRRRRPDGRTCTMTARRPPLSIRDEDVSTTAAAGIKPVSSRWSHTTRTYTAAVAAAAAGHGWYDRVVPPKPRRVVKAPARHHGRRQGISRATHGGTRARKFASSSPTRRARTPVVYLFIYFVRITRNDSGARRRQHAERTWHGSFVAHRDARFFEFVYRTGAFQFIPSAPAAWAEYFRFGIPPLQCASRTSSVHRRGPQRTR